MKNLFKDKRIICMYIITVILIITGIAYALQEPLFDSSQTTAYVNIDETAYGDNIFDSTNLDLKPILDKDIETSDNNIIKIEFNVGGSKENNVDNIVYDIALVDLNIDCKLLSPYVKWKLVKNKTEVYEGSLDYKFDTINNGRLVLTPIQQDLKKYNEDKSTYDHYEFYMWLSDSCQEEELINCINNAEDQSDLLNKKIKGKIEVELYKESKKELVRNPNDKVNVKTCIMENGEEYES